MGGISDLITGYSGHLVVLSTLDIVACVRKDLPEQILNLQVPFSCQPVSSEWYISVVCKVYCCKVYFYSSPNRMRQSLSDP